MTQRARSRRAGRASGRARRKLALKRRGLAPGPGTRGLPLDYELRRLSRREFDALYLKNFPRPERPTALASYERCREAVWKHVCGVYGLLAVKGQHCRTTHPQRALAMAERRTPRSVRTLYNYNQRLEALGIARVMHYKTPPGKKDCLSVEWRVTRKLTCRPTTSTKNPWLRQGGSSPSGRGVPPPSAADEDPPDKPAERPATREEEISAQLRFQQLKLDTGFGDPEAVRRQIARLRLEEACAHRSPAPDGSGSDG